MNQSDKKIHVLLVGGGTGGHFYPLISIAETLKTSVSNLTLYYAGPTEYDRGSLNAENIQFVYTPAGKQRRYSSILNFFDLFKTAFGLLVAICKLYVIYPDVVMSKGGYTSVPVVLAAWFLRIPIIVHESDAVPGKANLLAARFARTIIVAYPESVSMFNHHNVLHLGIPIRKSLLVPPSEKTIELLNIDPNRPAILILGGSQGAEIINNLILTSLPGLLKNFSILHQTGTNNFETCTATANTLVTDPLLRVHYHPTAFLSGDMLNNAYHAASLVISRAGSTSIYEIALHNKPSIIIPIPESISHDQRTNAYTYARSGAATVIEESNLTDSLLLAEIDRIMQNEDTYKQMSAAAQSFAKTNASEAISSLLVGIAQEH